MSQVASKINWVSSLEEGLERARDQNRLVFVDFFNPG